MADDVSSVLPRVGDEGLRRLVAAFYARVRADDLLSPLYPPEDFEGAEARLAGFLVFRLGGADDYVRERGHPRLRRRHLPFPIGAAERDRWLALMDAALVEAEIAPAAAEALRAFFRQTADSLVNR